MAFAIIERNDSPNILELGGGGGAAANPIRLEVELLLDGEEEVILDNGDEKVCAFRVVSTPGPRFRNCPKDSKRVYNPLLLLQQDTVHHRIETVPPCPSTRQKYNHSYHHYYNTLKMDLASTHTHTQVPITTPTRLLYTPNLQLYLHIYKLGV